MFRAFRSRFRKQDSGSKRRVRHLRLEALEARQMLSYTPYFAAEEKWHDRFCENAEIPLVGDFNGDHKADLATFTRGSTGDVYVALSNGTGFGQRVKWHDWFCANTETPLVGDFNGDGKDDIATFTRGSAGDVFVALSNGSSFVGQGIKWHANFCVNAEIPLVGDFNGDGKADIATFTRGSTGDVFVALSNGSSFGNKVKWHDWFCINDEIPLAGDFNGDNKADLATFTRGGAGDVFVALSDGSRFNGQGLLWHDWFCINSETPLAADFDGDGKDDLATFTGGDTGDVYLAFSEGNGFSDPAWKWHDSFCYGQDLPALGDFNGDGKADLARFTRGTSADVYVSRYAQQVGANYAVLFSGGITASQNYVRYYDNIKELYQTLVGQCNFRPENVYIVYADGTDPADDRNDGDSKNVILENSDMSYAAGATVLSATKANLLDTLAQLTGQVDANDHFLFYSFDHGSGTLAKPGTTGEEKLCGWGGDIRDGELAPALKSINGKYNSYVFTECFAGGMLDDLMPLSTNRFGCAATNHYEYSWGDCFAAAFVDALQAGHRNTSTIFQLAWQNDAYAVHTSYPANGGTYNANKEHPWFTGGSFPMFLASPDGAGGTASSTSTASGQIPVGSLPSGNGPMLHSLALRGLSLLTAGIEDRNLPSRVHARQASVEAIGALDAPRQTVCPTLPRVAPTGNPASATRSIPCLLKMQSTARCASANRLSGAPLGYLDRELAKQAAVDAVLAMPFIV